MLKGRKKQNLARNPRVKYKKQQSYHYSSSRSTSNRTFNRQEITLENENNSDGKSSILKNLPMYISVILILISVYYLLTLSLKPQITVLNNNAKTQLISKDILQKKANAQLSKSILYRFKPIFDERKLETELLKSSAEITNITVKTSALKHHVQIMVEFSEPSLVLSTGSNLYVVGSDGKALADITKTKDGFDISTLPLVQDQSDVIISVGKIALTSAQIDYIQQIKHQTDQKQLNTSSMAIMPGGSELHVRYGGLSYYVKYNFFEDAKQSSGVFLATREKLNADGVVPSEYIDVRVSERAYIK